MEEALGKGEPIFYRDFKKTLPRYGGGEATERLTAYSFRDPEMGEVKIALLEHYEESLRAKGLRSSETIEMKTVIKRHNQYSVMIDGELQRDKEKIKKAIRKVTGVDLLKKDEIVTNRTLFDIIDFTD
ncbi:hypothetical protein A3K64_03760 [Candidatus Micrarchaeota archaeon RBG_16_36_9]|nr:MAG: hypothetical protein A3K64_03760 [Candidatus Micrarchaeota archaeon RBG_16_36_9]